MVANIEPQEGQEEGEEEEVAADADADVDAAGEDNAHM
jgi:hypothetical protein